MKIGLLELLTLLFVTLKLTNVIHWSWFWVVFPTIFSIIIGILFGIWRVYMERQIPKACPFKFKRKWWR